MGLFSRFVKKIEMRINKQKLEYAQKQKILEKEGLYTLKFFVRYGSTIEIQYKKNLADTLRILREHRDVSCGSILVVDRNGNIDSYSKNRIVSIEAIAEVGAPISIDDVLDI